jgi:hypothetical protein
LKKLNTIICTILFLLVPYALMAQDDEFDYESEFTYGINFNTNAGIIGGLVFKYAKAAGKNQFQSFGLEIVNVKHPKEHRFDRQYAGNGFIVGKALYLIAVRPQYGREIILFRKAPEDGVQLNLVMAAGPSFGVTKPYHVLYSDDNNFQTARSVAYDPSIHNIERIYGSGPITDGFDNLRINLGAHAKTGFSFEFGRFNNSVVGIEIGLLMEAYTRKIEILPMAPNRSVYPSAFFTLYYGNKY